MWLDFTPLELEIAIESAVSLLEQQNYEEWHRFAFLAAVIANIYSSKKKKFKPSDFIGPPPWERKQNENKIKITPENVHDVIEMIRNRKNRKRGENP